MALMGDLYLYPCTITLIFTSSRLLNPLRNSFTRSFQMGPHYNLHNPLNPTIMAHLKSSSILNHFFIFQKGFIFGGGGLLLPSFSSFVLAFPFFLALPSYSYIGASLPINIFFIIVVSLCNWFNFFIIPTMAFPSSLCNFYCSYFLSTLLLSLEAPIVLYCFSCYLSPC